MLGATRGDLVRLAAYDIVGGKTTPLAWEGAAGNAGNILHVDHAAETVLIQRSPLRGEGTGGTPEVVSANVRDGKVNMVQRPNPVANSGWIVDGNGVVRASVGGTESGRQRLMYRSNSSQQLRTVTNDRDESFTGTQIVPSVFLPEADMALATSNHSGFRRVYKVNMATMEIVGEPLFGVPGHDVTAIIPNRSRDGMLGVRYIDNRARIKWFDERLAAVQQFFDEDFGEANMQLVSANEDYSRLILSIGPVHAPGGYYIYDTEAGQLRLLDWAHPVLKGAEMNPMETIRYTASDGMEIPAVVTYPRHRPHRKNLPVVVMPHGGPFGVRDQEEFGFFPWHQALAELGYVVIQPNYRGSGGFGREFVLEGRKPDGYGQRMQDDKNDAVTWFAQTGLIDKDRACIMGWSYGGYAAARGAQRDADVWKCAIAGAGVYDFPMMRAFDTDTFGSFGASFQATADNLVAISSARNTGGKWAPILIVAGVRDARIPMEQSRTLVSRLKSSGKREGVDFRYIEQPKGTHNLPYEDVHIEWLVESEKWLERFNPAYLDTDPDKPLPVSVTAAIK